MLHKSWLSRFRLALTVSVTVVGCGQILGLEGGSLQNECATADQCAPGYLCLLSECRSGCSTDDDCGDGSRCLAGSLGSACIPNDAGCGEGCPDGTVCTAGSCVTACEGTADCPGGQTCEAGHCISDTPPGQGGNGGQGGAPSVVAALDAPCDSPGELACNGRASKVRLLCENGKWKSNGTCAAAESCNAENGYCEPMGPCEGLGPTDTACEEDTLYTCNTDVLPTSSVECDGRCAGEPGAAACVDASCGDEKTQANEECDDGANGDNIDGCTDLCKLSKCGDGYHDSKTEACDDGNSNNDDGCTEKCAEPVCGDGLQHNGVPFEECDDGNDDNTDECTTECHEWTCGDKFVQPGNDEPCDDGNAFTNDGCVSCKNIVQLATGTQSQHICIVASTGGVKCWGQNAFGQLGLGAPAHKGETSGEMGSSLPYVDLGTDRTPKTVAFGMQHTCAILDNDSLKCWGANSEGQLGLGDNTSRGNATGQMGNSLLPVNLGSGRTVKAVALGALHTCAILDNDAVKCWGLNTSGQLGVGNQVPVYGSGIAQSGPMGDDLPTVNLGSGRTAKAISAGNTFTCAILDNNTVKCWGANGTAGYGYGNSNIYGTAASTMGDNLPPVNLGTGRTAKAISLGAAHACAILDDNSVKCWGNNGSGRLGLGDTDDRGNLTGQMGNNLDPVNLGTGRTAKRIAAGDQHTCAILDDDSVKCWGENVDGQLGVGGTLDRGDDANEMGAALPALAFGSSRTAKAIAALQRNTCALLSDDTVHCWGDGSTGVLGQGNTTDSLTPPTVIVPLL